jgi:hypothetical protein
MFRVERTEILNYLHEFKVPVLLLHTLHATPSDLNWSTLNILIWKSFKLPFRIMQITLNFIIKLSVLF